MAFYVARVDSEGREVDRAYLAKNGAGAGEHGSCAGIRIRYPEESFNYNSCAGVFQEHGVSIHSQDSSPELLTSSSFSSDSMLSEESYVPPLCHIEDDDDAQTLGSSKSEQRNEQLTQRSSDSRLSSLTRPSVGSLDRTEGGYSSSERMLAANVEAHMRDKQKLSYNDWLSIKNKQIAQANALRKLNEQRNQQDLERRKLLARRKYEEWLAAKTAREELQQESQQQQQQQQQQHEHRQLPSSSSKPCSSMPGQQLKARERVQLSPEEMQRRLMAWENRKIAELEHKRLLRRIEEQRKRDHELRRKEANERAWRMWEATAAEKPKPVPLNCGMLSLRGTISAIYVNPNEWRSINEHNESAGDGDGVGSGSVKNNGKSVSDGKTKKTLMGQRGAR